MIRTISLVLFSIAIISGCNSSKHLEKNNCKKYHLLMKEFASKWTLTKDSCLVFQYEQDRSKYIEYNEFGGKHEFIDYRLNEVLYYQHNLATHFLDTAEKNKQCLKNYTKKDIIDLFGEGYGYNKYYNTMGYTICNPEVKINLSSLDFEFGKNGEVKSMAIHIYQL